MSSVWNQPLRIDEKKSRHHKSGNGGEFDDDDGILALGHEAGTQKIDNGKKGQNPKGKSVDRKRSDPAAGIGSRIDPKGFDHRR